MSVGDACMNFYFAQTDAGPKINEWTVCEEHRSLLNLSPSQAITGARPTLHPSCAHLWLKLQETAHLETNKSFIWAPSP